MLQKDKDRLGYAEGMSEKEAKAFQNEAYMNMYQSGNIDKEVMQAATNIAEAGTIKGILGNTMPQKEIEKRIAATVKNINSEPNPNKINPDFFKFIVNKEMEKLTENNREKKAEGELVGGQKELDKNNDGDITGEDFAIIRKEREGKQEGGMMGDQMDSMMQREEAPVMETQMTDMMPEKTEEQIEIEESQVPDEMMENSYIDFLIDEALDENEEEMLMEELQANPQLSMLFDKVMEVAMEFSGSGPVEGPGTEVSDSIPARLSDGEFVFTAKAVEEIGEDALTSMMKEAEAAADNRQGFAFGGILDTEEEEELQSSNISDDMRRVNPRLNPNLR